LSLHCRVQSAYFARYFVQLGSCSHRIGSFAAAPCTVAHPNAATLAAIARANANTRRLTNLIGRTFLFAFRRAKTL
jgi:hypothetical protein